ncbi:DgyrCDS5113 [Dimorphilus gyrociliatus]|uniref:DgyrCDS5113 n=1 Tax=Dimorphilus gyrociliatus TaxID=2664684 RepID=A0A7I8VNN3_9ANNE|nr:DgyrCDS5113 [Dimorphilus gyrociliatus]
MKRFGWDRIAIFTSLDKHYYFENLRSFRYMLQKLINIKELPLILTNSSNRENDLETMKARGLRIGLLTATNLYDTRRILNLAQKKDMLYNGWGWIMDLDVSDKFFTENYDISYSLFLIDLIGLMGIRYSENGWRSSVLKRTFSGLENFLDKEDSLKSNDSKYKVPKSICNNGIYSNPYGIKMIEYVREISLATIEINLDEPEGSFKIDWNPYLENIVTFFGSTNTKPKSFSNTLDGVHLTFTAWPFVPEMQFVDKKYEKATNWEIIYHSNSTSVPPIRGLVWEMLEHIRNTLKFSYTLRIMDLVKIRKTFPNEPQGVIRLLAENEVDIGLATFFSTQSYKKYVKFGNTIWKTKLVGLTAHENIPVGFSSFFNVVDYRIIIYLLVLQFIGYILLIIYGAFEDKKQRERSFIVWHLACLVFDQVSTISLTNLTNRRLVKLVLSLNFIMVLFVLYPSARIARLVQFSNERQIYDYKTLYIFLNTQKFLGEVINMELPSTRKHFGLTSGYMKLEKRIVINRSLEHYTSVIEDITNLLLPKSSNSLSSSVVYEGFVQRINEIISRSECRLKKIETLPLSVPLSSAVRFNLAARKHILNYYESYETMLFASEMFHHHFDQIPLAKYKHCPNRLQELGKSKFTDEKSIFIFLFISTLILVIVGLPLEYYLSSKKQLKSQNDKEIELPEIQSQTIKNYWIIAFDMAKLRLRVVCQKLQMKNVLRSVLKSPFARSESDEGSTGICTTSTGQTFSLSKSSSLTPPVIHKGR